MTEHMATTTDNPYNPFTQYDDWAYFDKEHGYNTESYLSRLVILPEEPSENEINDAINDAVNKIILNDILNIYTRVSREK